MPAPRPNATGVVTIDALSPRRRELLQLLAKGLTNEEISRALEISVGTVRSHVATLLEQLDVANRTEAAALYVAWEARPTQVAEVLRRPAIAVLPLVALGDDPHTRNIAAGLTEDLAALFARWCWFPVIATTSTQQARTLGRTSQEVAEQLGARFLVDGSVRVAGDRWRLSIHIDDAERGHRLWTDQREAPCSAVFEVQDAICQGVVAAAYPMLVARTQAELPHARPATELSAWELAHEGMAHRAIREPESNARALRSFQEAITREPDLVLAHFGVGLASYDAILNQWTPKAAAFDQLRASAEKCLDLAPHGAEGWFLLGRYAQSRGEWDDAVEPLEAAVGHNPSFALAHASLAQTLVAVGRSDESLVRMQHAVRLGPRSFVAMLSTLHFMRGEHVEALAAAEQTLLTNPRYSFARALAAASAWWLGDVERARMHERALRESSPGFHPGGFAATFGSQVESVHRLARALDEIAGR